jgi:hypothetical protein
MVAACLRAFRAVALTLRRSGWSITWNNCTTFMAMTPGGAATSWCLVYDLDTPKTNTNPCYLVTWSGLIWQLGNTHLNTHLRRKLIIDYLRSADLWLSSSPAWRWETLTAHTDPAADPTRVISPTPLLCTLLRQLLPIPSAHVSGPAAPLTSAMRPDDTLTQSASVISLCCA